MKLINIKKEKDAIKELKRLRLKKYFYNEIKIENIHLKTLNKFVKNHIFSKNSIYIAPSTLWAAMKSGGKNESHNFHGLSPQVVYQAVLNIDNPIAIYKSKRYANRYIVVTPVRYKNSAHIIAVIETGARLVNDINANINKLVTIYPKDKMSLQNNELLYQK